MARYREVERLGQGGSGEVWVCRRDTDGELFAVKRLADGAGPESVERFRREVTILAALRHPKVVPVVDAHLDEPPYFYVMPRYRTSLQAELEQIRGDEGRIRRLFDAVLEAVEFAHRQGVIHRDLKPENILMNSDEEVVVSDFGLGRILKPADPRLTDTGRRMGTPLYSAPEQAAAADTADERADVYALGRILYALYTGPLDSSVQDAEHLSPGVAYLVNRCTRAEPDNRFPSVQALRAAWTDLVSAPDSASGGGELDQLVKEMADADGISTAAVNRLLSLLLRHQEDPEHLCGALMGLHPQALGMLYQTDGAVTRQLIGSFVQHVIAGRWRAAELDRIGERCRDWFSVLSDYRVRAGLARCLLELGARHERRALIVILGEFLAAAQAPAQAEALVDALSGVEARLRLGVAPVLMLDALQPELRALFSGGG